MKILILSKEAWRDEKNGGNVLSNIFGGFDAEFAQIYCSDELPNNSICKTYFQMSDGMVIAWYKSRKKIGRAFQTEQASGGNAAPEEKRKPRLPGHYLRLCRELLWNFAKWKTEELANFVREFAPDLIFAPCYGNNYMAHLSEFVHGIFPAVPIVSYISDDFYSFKAFNLLPSYWISQLILRKNTRRAFKLYRFVYTMTEEQKEQCEKAFGAKMKILKKTGDFSTDNVKTQVHTPIRLVFAGGVYLNRYKTLYRIAECIRTLNRDSAKFVLDIYTANPIPQKELQLLNDGRNARVHPVVPLAELKEIYRQSDIALHVESFDFQNRTKVERSFSTKIVDCLDSGCATMAVCHKKQAGLAFLRRNDIGICVSDLKELRSVFCSIAENPEILIEYQKKANQFGLEHLNAETVKAELKKDFESVLAD